jgi:hypothetical protein
VPRHRVNAMRYVISSLLSVALTGITLLGIAASCAHA